MKLYTAYFIKVIILLLCYTNDTASGQSFEIRGKILDSITKTELQYAQIALYNLKDSVISYVISDNNGEFNIRNIRNLSSGMYINVHYLGYINKIRGVTKIENNRANLGNILLVRKDILINEVIVKGNVDYITNKFDRTVYSMNKNKTSGARSVADLLRTLPGVVVDNEGNIRYKGSSATIYIDEQPIKFQYSDIEMVPVDKIDKIELIDGAMYSGGSGNNGIINIKFKKNSDDGYSGLASSRTTSIDFKSLYGQKGFLNLNYKSKKYTFFLNTSLSGTNIKSETIGTNSLELNTSSLFQEIESSSDFSRKTNFNNIGLIYWPNSSTKIYITGGFYNLDYESNYHQEFQELDLDQNSVRNRNSYDENNNSNQLYKGINFSFWHSFDTLNSYIKVFSNYNRFSRRSIQNSVYCFNLMDHLQSDSTYPFSNRKNLRNDGINVNIFLNKVTSKNTRWNVSYNLELILHDTLANNHFISDVISLDQSQFDNSNSHRHSLSVRYGKKIHRWKLDLGINCKSYNINGIFKRYNNFNMDTTIKLHKSYFRLLPSITVGYSMDKYSVFKLTLSKTVNFPYFNKLSDYIDKTQLYNWYAGNSDLKPVEFYSAYLGFSYNKDNYNFTTDFFINYTENEVEDISIPLSSQLYLTKPENIAEVTNVGIDLSIWKKVNKNMNISISSSLFYLAYDNSKLVELANSEGLTNINKFNQEFGFYTKLNIEYQVKNMYTMFYLNYYSKRLTFDGYSSPWLNTSLNLTKRFLKDKLSLTLGIDNIFNDILDHKTYSKSFGVESNVNKISSQYMRQFILSIKYKIKQGDRGTKSYKLGG